jgi:hypothetical protein
MWKRYEKPSGLRRMGMEYRRRETVLINTMVNLHWCHALGAVGGEVCYYTLFE